jgi:N6-adenosine-specific RNA methylase IME4/ParB-like chromosome segregation protein Spo0J
MNLKINPAFQNLLPELSPDELATLRESIIRDGCREAIITWRGFIVDGHNRYAICTDLGAAFRTVEKEFTDDEAAMDWIDQNQLARRNLTADAFTLALGRRYNRQKKAAGGRSDRTFGEVNLTPPNTAARIAAEHGVSEATVKRAGKLAEEIKLSPRLQAAIQERKPLLQVRREIREEAREDRRQQNASVAASTTSPLVSGSRFATILIDPPWDWGDEGDANQMGRAKPDYATMGIDELKALPIGRLSDIDCHMYCWITNRSLPKGFELLSAWGFRYVTMLTWGKKSFGLGNYFRGQSEHLLFGVKGSQMLKRKDAGTMLPQWDRGKGGHSSKPEEIYGFIESCSPGPYLEMFSRTDRKGWTRWGADAK